MTFPTKFLLGFCVLAVFGAGISELYQLRLDARLEDAVRACKEEGDELARKRASEPKGLWFQVDGLVCDPKSLDSDSVGVQKQIVDAYREARSQRNSGASFAIALALLFVGGIPHIWYFLLRRLREIAAAIRGD